MKHILVVRCDASLIIGFGHVYRCLHLAKYIQQELNLKVVFVMRELPGNLVSYVEEEGFEVLKLDTGEVVADYENLSTWNECRPELEITQLIKITNDLKAKFLLIDHYSIDRNIEAAIRLNTNLKIISLDDLNRPHDADAVIDFNFSLDYESKYQNIPLRLLGPEFIKLSKSFENQKKVSIKRSVTTITVFFGGSDLKRLTLNFTKLIVPNFKDIIFNIVVGKNNPDIFELKEFARSLSNMILHIQIGNIAEILSNSDLCIASGGTNTWERAYLGLPTICISTAKNQERIAAELDIAEIHIYAGTVESIDWLKLKKTIRELIENITLREKLSLNSLKLNVQLNNSHILQLFKK